MFLSLPFSIFASSPYHISPMRVSLPHSHSHSLSVPCAIALFRHTTPFLTATPSLHLTSFYHPSPFSTLLCHGSSALHGFRSVDCLAVFERDVIAHTEQHLHHRVYTIDACHISPVYSGRWHVVYWAFLVTIMAS